jgi:hypothetical protein
VNCSEFQVKADALLDAQSVTSPSSMPRTSSTALRSHGQLSNSERTALETHLVACDRCRSEFEIARNIRSLYRRRFHYRKPPSGTIEGVQRALEREYASLVVGRHHAPESWTTESLDWLG